MFRTEAVAMRTAVLASLVILALAPTAPAQDGWAAKVFTPDAGGKPPAGHNFGTVPKGAQLQHRFPVTNIYAVPLQIQTRVSCDCVSVTASPQTLQPWESGTLDIAMDTR